MYLTITAVLPDHCETLGPYHIIDSEIGAAFSEFTEATYYFVSNMTYYESPGQYMDISKANIKFITDPNINSLPTFSADFEVSMGELIHWKDKRFSDTQEDDFQAWMYTSPRFTIHFTGCLSMEESK